MPQRLARVWIVSNEVPGAVISKQQIARGAQQALCAAGGRSFPDYVPSLIVDRTQEASGIAGAPLGGTVALRPRIRVGQVKH